MENYQDYTTVKASDPKRLANSVRNWMKEGWVPLGSVAIAAAMVDEHGNVRTDGKDGLVYVQAMVQPVKPVN